MSELTREQILKLIEENGGPEGLDLSGKYLSGIDLSREAIQAELKRARRSALDKTPVWYSKMTEGINLAGAELQGALLMSAKLQGADLAIAKLQNAFLRGADLQEAFLLDANLQGIHLRNANLKRAHLTGADLKGADLRDADLRKADLRSATLQGADLKGTNLQKANLLEVNLKEADLRYANLREANFWDANFEGAKLGADLQEAYLRGANFQRADLSGARLQKADLSFASFQEAILRGARVQGAEIVHADFRGAKLEFVNLKGANLNLSHLEKVDLFAAESLEGTYFFGVFLDDTRMRREQLGEAIGEELEGRYDEAKEAYLALKNNFAEIGRYRDESWAYVKERQMGKMMHHPRLARKYYGEELPENPDAWRLWWFYIRHTAKWAIDEFFFDQLCEYGESIPRTLRAMGVALAGFAILYWLLGAVVDVSGNPSSSWLHCLLYSGGAFTTLGVDTLRPANDWVRALSILESVMGIALTGLLGFVLGNRIRRS